MTSVTADDIAIVGMACLFPGAADIEAFWRNIVGKVDAITEPTEGAPGGYLGELARFDPIPFGIVPKAVDGAEPEQFIALQVAEAALRDAGVPGIPIDRERTEVLVGRGTYANRGLANLNQHGLLIDQAVDLLGQLLPLDDSTRSSLRRNLESKLPPFDSLTAPGVVSSMTSGRIANRLDLNGANYTIDGACASSLIALEQGVAHLRAGTCDAALIGAVQLSLNRLVRMIFSKLGAVSGTGRISPFDESADGTILGEGAGMMLLKRRADAERDGNRVYAMIKAVGVSSDGRATSVIAPRLEGEVLALRRAYETAAIRPGSVDLVEAHGTGIALGDRTEMETLDRVLGDDPTRRRACAVGTVKSMIGHLLPAAGIAGLIKTALALYHRTLPPSLRCEQPTGACRERRSLYVNTETRPWVHGTDAPRRAGVNAFGFGGINAHAILEEAPESPAEHRPDGSPEWDSELCVFAASTRETLVEKLAAMADRLEGKPRLELRDVACALNTSIAGQSCRLAIVAASLSELAAKARYALKRLGEPGRTRLRDRSGIFYTAEPLAREGKVAFLFPGEGSQYPGMLEGLCLHFGEVRRIFDLADAAFVADGSSYVLSDFVFPPPRGDDQSKTGDGTDALWEMEAGVQAVTTANRAMHGVLRRLGLRPDVVCGHSSGEFAALEATGVFGSADEADLVSYVRRGKRTVREVTSVAAERTARALLLAVATENATFARDLAERSQGRLVVAMDNCPYQVVLCGDPDAIDGAMDELKRAGATCTVLPFDRPYHTSAFAGCCGPLERFFGELPAQTPAVALYSCATAALYPDDPDAIRRLAVAQWTQPVRFRETIEAMYRDGVRIFVEVGPRSNLTAFVNDILRNRPYLAVNTDSPQRPGMRQLHMALGLLVTEGVEMDLGHLYQHRDIHDVAGERPVPDRQSMPPLELALPHPRLTDEEAEAIKARLGERETVDAPAALTTSRAGMLREQLRVMDEFLVTQERMARAYLARRTVASAPNGTASALPFIGTIVERAGTDRLVARRVLNIDEDTFLRDHVLGGAISTTDPTLLPLPVMPMTMSVEMLAEAAAALAPGQVVIGLREIRAKRWIVVDKPLEVELVAEKTHENEIHVAMRATGAGTGFRPPMIEATVVMAASYPRPHKAPARPLRDPRSSRFTNGQVYTSGMFSGPSFQVVTSLNEHGLDGVTATLETPADDGLFRSTTAPGFVAHPVLLDGAGQLLAHWHAEDTPEGFNLFPYRIGAINFYGPYEARRRIEARVSIERIDEQRIRSDFDLVSPDGRVLVEVRGWEDRSFDLPPIFHKMVHGAPPESAGTPCPMLLGEHAGDDAFECRRVAFDRRLLLDHGAIWLKTLAAMILSRTERVAFAALQEGDTVAWLLERAAVKDAVSVLMRRRHGLDLRPADIEVETSSGPGVTVGGAWTNAVVTRPSVCVAGNGTSAAAVATDGPDLPSTIDLSAIEDSPVVIGTNAANATNAMNAKDRT